MPTPFPARPAPAEEPPLSEHYEILHAIGRGSFGQVYLARDRAGQSVAIKEFPVSAAVAQGFFRELSIVFSLDHPNIVRCLNLFYGHRGRNFLIFEYVPGGTLRDLLEARGSLPLAESLPLLRQLCLGLEHAHGRRIVHRDLKPENILLASDGPHPLTPKIADLGLAQYLGAVRGTGDHPQRDGSGDGSPAYMAPEQFYDQVTPASDLYALGVLAYEVLAGRRPFEGAPARLLLAHLHELPDLTAIPHAGCRALIGDLLAKQPGRRPPDAATVLARLEELGNGEEDAATVTAAPSGFPPASGPSPQTSDDGLAPGVWWRFTGTDRTWSFPAASGLHVLDPGRDAHVLLAHAHCTDRLDLTRDRLTPGFLTEEVRAVCLSDGSAPAFLATRRSVREFDPRGERTRTVFAHGVNDVRAFAVDPARGRFFLADDQRVFAMDAAGRTLWNRANGNYAVEPQLAMLADGRLAVTTGLAAPAVRLFDAAGEEQLRVALPAPALALRSLPGTEDPRAVRFQVVLIGLGAEEPARLMTFAGDRITGEVELGDGVFAARWHRGGLLSVCFRDNRVAWHAPDGRELATHRAGGPVLGDCWLPAARGVLLLEDDPARRERVVRLLSVELLPDRKQGEQTALAKLLSP